MISTLSLLGGGLGGLLRFAPEVFKMINAKGDREHEFRMSKLQLEIDQKRANQQIDLVHAQSDAGELAAQGQAYLEAIKGQARPTGIPWVDAVNSMVRPGLTMWWMLIFTAFKATVIADAWNNFSTWKSFGQQVWTENDWGVLSMIISFWFVDRVFRKHSEK